jgi:hypothetical protein
MPYCTTFACFYASLAVLLHLTVQGAHVCICQLTCRACSPLQPLVGQQVIIASMLTPCSATVRTFRTSPPITSVTAISHSLQQKEAGLSHCIRAPLHAPLKQESKPGHKPTAQQRRLCASSHLKPSTQCTCYLIYIANCSPVKRLIEGQMAAPRAC